VNATIHPRSYRTLVRCSNCGSEHDLTSTRERLGVEVCSRCHPFFTGSDSRVSSGGRIARFETRRARARGASA
jgi:large subunit ribosomal protein L31